MTGDYKGLLSYVREFSSGKIDYIKTAFRNNKDVAIALGGSLALDLVATYNGKQPFYNCDKIAHVLFGYGMSRIGRKLARKAGYEKHENITSLGLCLVSGVGLEIIQSDQHISTFDYLDIGSDILGSFSENVREVLKKT